jgi:hypothetical protein
VSQRTQIRHIAKLPQYGRIAEITGSRIACAAERDCACMTEYFPKTLRTLYRGCRAWTFNRFTNNHAAVSNIERQRHEICNSGHDLHFSAASSFQIGVSRGRSQIA